MVQRRGIHTYLQVGAVATAAGAGGGALFVPLFSSFLHFSKLSPQSIPTQDLSASLETIEHLALMPAVLKLV